MTWEDLHDVVLKASFLFLPPSGSSFPCPPRGRERSNHRTQTEDALRETKLGQRVHQHRFEAPRVSFSWEMKNWQRGRTRTSFLTFEFWCVFRSKVGVFLCGPPQLGKSLEKQCLSHSEADVKFIFNKENFWTSSDVSSLVHTTDLFTSTTDVWSSSYWENRHTRSTFHFFSLWDISKPLFPFSLVFTSALNI